MDKTGSLSIGSVMRPVFILLAVAMVVLLLQDETQPGYYNCLFLLPLSFAFISFLFPSVYRLIPSNLGVSLLVFLLFYRSVVLPIFMYLGNYETLLKINIWHNAKPAAILMGYELLAVFITIYYTAFTPLKPRMHKVRTMSGFFYLIVGLAVLTCIYAWFALPALHKEYRTIFNMYDKDFTLVLFHKENLSFFYRALSTLFGFLFGVLRLAISLLLLDYIAKRFHHYNWCGIVVSFGIIFLQLFFVTSTIAFSLICVVLLFVYLASLYPRQRKMLYVLSGGGAVLFVGFYFISRFLFAGSSYAGSGSVMNFMSMSQHAYFSGINNVAASFNVDYQYPVGSLLTDFKHTIPFNTTLLGVSSYPGSQEVFNKINHSMGQIPTSIGMGYSYFGALFSPVFSIIMTFLCTRYGKLINYENNKLYHVVYLSVALYAAMGIVMYNFFISLGTILAVSLPLYYLVSYHSSNSNANT